MSNLAVVHCLVREVLKNCQMLPGWMSSPRKELSGSHWDACPDLDVLLQCTRWPDADHECPIFTRDPAPSITLSIEVQTSLLAGILLVGTLAPKEKISPPRPPPAPKRKHINRLFTGFLLGYFWRVLVMRCSPPEGNDPKTSHKQNVCYPPRTTPQIGSCLCVFFP